MLYSMLCKAKLKLLASCEGTLMHCRLQEKMSVDAVETSVFTVASETPGLGTTAHLVAPATPPPRLSEPRMSSLVFFCLLSSLRE